MGTIIVEQFNPGTGCWNKLYEVDQESFDADVPITVDKYGGPYRNRLVGESIVIPELVIPEPVEEKASWKRFIKQKRIL